MIEWSDKRSKINYCFPFSVVCQNDGRCSSTTSLPSFFVVGYLSIRLRSFSFFRHLLCSNRHNSLERGQVSSLLSSSSFLFRWSLSFSVSLPSQAVPTVVVSTSVTISLLGRSFSPTHLHDYFRQHAHFVISAIQFSKCVSLFAAPAIVGVLVDYDEDVRGWNEIFLGFGALLILVIYSSLLDQTR